MRKMLSIVLAFLMLLTMVPMGAIAVSAATSGTTGDCTWVLNGTQLTISGNGKMADYGIYGNTAPWGRRITTAIIGDGVTYVGKYAFVSCTSLTSVTIGKDVTTISKYAITSCSALTTIKVNDDNNVYSSQDGVLFNKKQTTMVYYPEGKGSSYVVPDGVTTIGENAFSDCTQLTDITIPLSVVTIGEFAFSGCTALANVYYKGNSTQQAQISISNYNAPISNAFWNYMGITGDCTWILSGTCLTISGNGAMANYAFGEKTPWSREITSVVFEAGVSAVGDYAFYMCKDLSSVTFGDGIETIGYRAFYDCDSITAITIPDSVLAIGDEAFAWSAELTSATLGNGIITIGEKAFADCTALSSMTIPSSVSAIGESAFDMCWGLKDVYYDGL